jgi:hypothetical protein
LLAAAGMGGLRYVVARLITPQEGWLLSLNDVMGNGIYLPIACAYLGKVALGGVAILLLRRFRKLGEWLKAFHHRVRLHEHLPGHDRAER